MTWFDVDGARAYLSQGESKLISRQTIYRMVADGLQVHRAGTTGKRYRFAQEWIDAYMTGKSDMRDARTGGSLPGADRLTADVVCHERPA
jgi:predicted DNA-binding transcriptional regulator AlpA